MTFDPVGNLKAVDGPLATDADTVRTDYNGARQPTMSVSPDPDGAAGPLKPRAVRRTYNSTGLLEKVEQGNVDSLTDPTWPTFSAAQAVETVYDSNARPIVGKRVSGSTVHALSQTRYDVLGRPDCRVQRMDKADFGSPLPDACAQTSPAGPDGPDRISAVTYDLAGRVTKVTSAIGTADAADETVTTYTPNGQVESVTDGENNKTTYEYDGHDRLAKTYYPTPSPKGAGTSNASDYEQLTYESLAGGTRTSPLVVAFRNRANQTAAFGYDALGRQTSKDLPGSEPDVTYGYDLLGQLTSASRTGHALGFTYDALGRVLNQTGPLGTLASEWDIAGRRTKLTWPDSFYVTYDYLVTGENTAIRENGASSGLGVLATIAYDDLGRRTSLTLGNGLATTYAYDTASRLGQLKLELPGTTDDLTSTFEYNPASQIAKNIRSNDAYAWTGHGSGTTSTTSNGLNQIAGWVSILGYDSKGNITSDGTYTYGYSSENLLTSLANSASGALQPNIAFAYDPLMRLAAIDSSNAVFDVQFGYDGQEMVYEGLSDNRTRRYVFGPGVDEPLVGYLITPGVGTSRLWYQADERGSITRLSNDSGTPGSAIGKYDEYGVGGTSRFRYTGQYWLGEANLLYYRARVYDARLGRFLQPDPIGYGGGMNMYAYVGGDPVNFSDPTGLLGEGCPGTLASKCPESIGHMAREYVDANLPTVTGAARKAIIKLVEQAISGLIKEPDLERMINGELPDVYQIRFASDIVITGQRIESFVTEAYDFSQYLRADFGGALRSTGGAALSAIGLGNDCGCLEAETLVATPNGLVRIEEIQVGDLVFSVSEETGELAPKRVTDIIRPHAKSLYRLLATDAAGQAKKFHATADHPWKVWGKGWVETVDLVPGDRIATGPGASIVVASLTLTDRIERPYNLTVADWHTFLIGSDLAIVHNACEIADTLETLGAGIPDFRPTPKGAPQFIFPNGMIVRFDLQPGQYLRGQSPHINIERAPGSANPNIHVPIKP